MGKFWLIISFIFLAGLGLSAQTLENYSGTFKHQTNRSWNYKSDVITTDVDVSSFPASKLKFQVPAQSTVFLNNKIWFFSQQDTTILVPLKDLHERFDFGSQQTVPMVIYGHGISKDDIFLEKGYFENIPNQMGFVDLEDSNKRIRSSFKDFYYLSICILFILFGIVKSVFPVELNYMLSPLGVITFGDNLEGNPKFFSLDVLFFLFLTGLAIVQSVMFFMYYFNDELTYFFNPANMNDLFFKWIIGSLAFVGLSILKYLYLNFMTFVFNIKKFEIIHFFYLLRIISLMAFGLILFQLLILTNDLIVLKDWELVAKNIFFGVYLIATVLLFIAMTNQVDFKFYHLIAYLCTAELLPFLIITKHLIW
ncbi:DUF4271 domain-containing protein [Mongoliitalea lutea]|uniref:DUF4271 domain-containing protein n=1 Tax=Mongoliitalea lutea TaxID=849756 RepID=A0A8J3CWQ8_9BACT|nr:DUF4271 domain-containing protein [Mongoliitalea lutea]GHB30663.1 hypothetical protein GCM10008106_09440 [Mongoliitalea lutea]